YHEAFVEIRLYPIENRVQVRPLKHALHAQQQFVFRHERRFSAGSCEYARAALCVFSNVVIVEHERWIIVTECIPLLPLQTNPWWISDHCVKSATLGHQIRMLEFPVEETMHLRKLIREP